MRIIFFYILFLILILSLYKTIQNIPRLELRPTISYKLKNTEKFNNKNIEDNIVKNIERNMNLLQEKNIQQGKIESGITGPFVKTLKKIFQK